MSFDTKTREIEFVGGPLDGHRDVVPLNRIELAEMVAIPVNQNMLSALRGQKRNGPKMPATSVGVYELRVSERAVRYEFIGSATARQMRFENWTG